MLLAFPCQLRLIRPRLVSDALLQDMGLRLMHCDHIHAPRNDFDQE